ncbi:hypothetical protein EYC84_005728 [Monilinia fructicola]|uniref:Uncharacterized protein n=1 Tax=Monilinia fructicola TaxID=38448 RepID=A0A5M9K2K2_MONFR|nr:hypothetical protein EYC84_005728 [Monilinia fructicola]
MNTSTHWHRTKVSTLVDRLLHLKHSCRFAVSCSPTPTITTSRRISKRYQTNSIHNKTALNNRKDESRVIRLPLQAPPYR